MTFTSKTDEVDIIHAADIDALQNAVTAVTPQTAGGYITVGPSSTITEVKPGRIDARVRGVSTAAADNTALLTSLLQEVATTGAQLWLPDGSYKAAITVDNTMNGAHLAGVGTLQGVGGASPILLNGDQTGGHAISDFTVEGIALDGAGAANCITTTGGGPINGVTWRGVRFRNTGSANGAYHDSSGHTNLIISDCIVEATCGAGFGIISPAALQIVNNRFEGTLVGNFISVTLYNGEPYSGGGTGIIIAGNVGQGGKRMGVEVFGNGLPIAKAVVVANNWFDVTGGSYGLSIVGCAGAEIIGNAVFGDAAYGLEIGTAPQTVHANWVEGFATGIILNNAPRCTVTGNILNKCHVGIQQTTSGTNNSVVGGTIQGNHVLDPRDQGILFGLGGTGGTDGLELVAENVIWRSQVEADDSTRTFAGIQSPVPTSGPRIFRNNRITQANNAPTLANFIGIYCTGTNTQRTRMDGNIVANLGGTPFGQLFGASAADASVQGMIWAGNHGVNLAKLFEFSTAAAPVIMLGNTATGGTGPAQAARQYFGLSLSPMAYSEAMVSNPLVLTLRGHTAGVPSNSTSGTAEQGDFARERAPVSGGNAEWVAVGHNSWKKANPIIEHLTATATLDFPSVAAGSTAPLTITVAGAAVGDAVYLGPPATLEAGLVATGYVSAANTVTVRLANVTTAAIDPASATWRATVLRPS